MSLDLDRLAKLLNLTKSDSDPEALLAMRRANAMVTSAGRDWHHVFNLVLKPGGSPGFKSRYTRDECDDSGQIERMFSVVRAGNLRGSALEFIESLWEQFTDRGSLTRKQFNALKKFYDNAR